MIKTSDWTSLYELKTVDEKINKLLELGTKALGQNIGIISRIQNNNYVVKYAYSTGDPIAPGTTFKLGDTYCSVTMRQKQVVAIPHFSISEFNRHPCYQLFKLEAYIGTPIMVKDQVYGTLNFSSAAVKTSNFTETEQHLVQVMGLYVGTLLENKRISAS
ncbi:MAG: GAF domain-containing protein [Chloroflexi bacterium]|nr:MAG: GAF domain-containing protein [Chloroflexota bacterium]